MFAAFPLALPLIGEISLVALPVGVILQSHSRNRDRRTVICPDNQERSPSRWTKSTPLRPRSAAKSTNA
jgi:hypothetical protein